MSFVIKIVILCHFSRNRRDCPLTSENEKLLETCLHILSIRSIILHSINVVVRQIALKLNWYRKNNDIMHDELYSFQYMYHIVKYIIEEVKENRQKLRNYILSRVAEVR